MAIIDTVVSEYVARHESFTSVDIANEVKRRGEWIRNRDVASYLRGNMLAIPDYTSDQIVVSRSEDGTNVNATLYHHLSVDPAMYDRVHLKPMTPSEFDALHPAVVVAPDDTNDPVSDAPNKVDDDPTGVKTAASTFKKFNFPK